MKRLLHFSLLFFSQPPPLSPSLSASRSGLFDPCLRTVFFWGGGGSMCVFIIS